MPNTPLPATAFDWPHTPAVLTPELDCTTTPRSATVSAATCVLRTVVTAVPVLISPISTGLPLVAEVTAEPKAVAPTAPAAAAVAVRSDCVSNPRRLTAGVGSLSDSVGRDVAWTGSRIAGTSGTGLTLYATDCTPRTARRV